MFAFIISLLFSPIFWFGVAVGLIVGWNLLAQPDWIKRRYDAVRDWWKSIGASHLDPFD